MRVGFVSQWYDPEGSSAALPGVISRALAQQGHEVHVLTGFPNYPTGEVFDEYRVRPYLREEIRGVTVHRAPLYASHDSRAARRAANYLSFAAGASAVALTKLPKLDAVLVHGTPATAALPALALKAAKGVPFVYQVQDLWPQTVLDSGFLRGGKAGVERALHRFVDRVYRDASSVAVIAPGMVEHVVGRGVPREKVSLIPNWADESAFRPAEKDPALAAQLGTDRRFTVMYAGIFGAYQRLDVLVEAANTLRDRRDIGFALVGGGVEEQRLRDLVARYQLDNVTFIPMQPFDRMAEILALGDVQLVSLDDLPIFRATLPSKLQATLAAGRPVLAAISGDAADVIRESGAGAAIPPGSVPTMVEAITHLAALSEADLAALGRRGRAHYLANYGEAASVTRMTELLEHAAGRSRHGAAA